MNLIKEIELKLIDQVQLDREDALYLYREAPLEWLKEQASLEKEKRFGKDVYWNRNIHFEPTNICVYSCKFCAFYRKPGSTSAEGAWEFTFEDLERELKAHPEITEIHITGGVHPDRGVEYGVELIQKVRSVNPTVHIKAFTAVEISFFARKSKMTLEQVLSTLKEAGLGSLPGGGAEIFDPSVRRKIAGGKAPAHAWLDVHRAAHRIGLASNATMLYGHIEKFEHRIDHMERLVKLQEEHQGFNSFIPLRYLNQNNALSELPELSAEQDYRNFAVSRLFLKQIPHLKAYWVMLGVPTALGALDYGVDDLDGTIDDSTQIYSMAGGAEAPTLRSADIESLIREKLYRPVERNSLYELIK